MSFGTSSAQEPYRLSVVNLGSLSFSVPCFFVSEILPRNLSNVASAKAMPMSIVSNNKLSASTTFGHINKGKPT